MKAHKMDMIAAWAKENGIAGYDHYDRRNREKTVSRRPRKPQDDEWKEWESDGEFDKN
jgi:hypothetical protein